MKIGFVFDDSLDRNDGVQQYVKTLGSWFSQNGHDVSYLVGQTVIKDWAGGKVYSLSKNIGVKFNANRLTIPLTTSSKSIKNILSIQDFDVLHFQLPYSPLMAQKVLNNSGKKTVIVGTFHILPAGILHKLGSSFLSKLYGNNMKKFDQIYSVSQPAANFALKTFKIKSHVLPNAVDINKFKIAQQPALSSRRQIVFLGRLVERKGILELLKAFKLLDSNVQLKIAGSGPLLKKVQNFLKVNNLQNSVQLLGQISEDDKPKLLSSADLAIFPSKYGESFGIVLIEAMAAGAGVVIAGNNPGYLSVLGENPDCIIDPSNSHDFAKQIDKLLTDQKLYDQLHAWQQDLVGQYDVSVVGNKLLKEYQRLIAIKNNSSIIKL